MCAALCNTDQATESSKGRPFYGQVVPTSTKHAVRSIKPIQPLVACGRNVTQCFTASLALAEMSLECVRLGYRWFLHIHPGI
jgi:hypothetical protein